MTPRFLDGGPILQKRWWKPKGNRPQVVGQVNSAQSQSVDAIIVGTSSSNDDVKARESRLKRHPLKREPCLLGKKVKTSTLVNGTKG